MLVIHYIASPTLYSSPPSVVPGRVSTPLKSFIFHKKYFQKSEHGLFHNLPCPISEINFLKKSDQKMKQELPQLSDLMIISVLIFIMINFVAIGKGFDRVSDIIALH